MDRKIPREICFHKDDSDSGEDDDDRPYNIFHPSAGAANDRERPHNDRGYDTDVTDPDSESDFMNENDDTIIPMNDDTADTSDGVTTGANEDGQLRLPERGDIFHVLLAVYYYTDGSGPFVPEPEKNWHVQQRITSAK